MYVPICFQTSLKSLNESKPNFMWSLLWKRRHKFIKKIFIRDQDSHRVHTFSRIQSHIILKFACNIWNPNSTTFISSPEPLGSQGELIVYPCSGVRPSVVRHHPSTIFKHLPRNRLANQSQILCGASLGKGIRSLINRLGHMTKMAITLIYRTFFKKRSLFWSENFKNLCLVFDFICIYYIESDY